MFEKIRSLIQNEVDSAVSNNAEIPEDRKNQAVSTVTSTLMDSLKQYATPANISKITSFISGGKSTDSAVNESGVVQGVQSNVVQNLMSKVGLSQSAASSIAASMIPAIMKMFSNKVNDENEHDFNLGSILDVFTGNN